MKNIIVMDFSNTILVAQEKNMNNCKSFRIKEELKKEILNTGCRNGEKISSVRVLASRFSISTATARKILQNLVKEKILVPHKGVGYFIGENKVPGILIIWNSAVPDAKNHPTGTLTLRYITEYLEKNNFKYDIIYGNTFQEQPEKIVHKMKNYDGILFTFREDKFNFNEMAIKILNTVNKKIVCFRYENLISSLRHSHVIPDFTTGLSTLAKKTVLVKKYSKFVIVSAYDEQAKLREMFLKDFLTDQGIKEDSIEVCHIHSTSYTRSYLAEKVFHEKCSSYPQDTLILAVSYYFSPGIQQACECMEKKFDIISVDNQESYIPGLKHRFFTALDTVRPRIGLEAAKLLVRMIREKDDSTYILKVPTKLVIRKSTHRIMQGGKK